jgi:hypothetical protein
VKPLDVLGVRVEMPTNQPIVLLRERDGSRHLPIWIGAAEATAIAYAQEGVEPPRPLTHDLVVNLLGRARARPDPGAHRPADRGCLPRDPRTQRRHRGRLALLRRDRAGHPHGAEVVAPEALLESAGITIAETADDEVERFKEFLDHVSPEDFE